MDTGIRPAFPAGVVAAVVVVGALAAQLVAERRTRPAWGGEPGRGSLACAAGNPGSRTTREGIEMTGQDREAAARMGASGNLQIATFALG